MINKDYSSYHYAAVTYGGKLWLRGGGTMANLANDHEFAKFTQPNFSNFKKFHVTKILFVLVLILKHFKWTPIIQDNGNTNPFLFIERVSPQTFVFMMPLYHCIQRKRVHLLSSRLLTP